MKMKTNFVDCFLLMNTAMSMRGVERLTEMNRPQLQDVFTTIINISLTVQNFQIVSSHSMEAQLTGLLNQQWTDSRLGATERTRKMAVAGQIWKPKITNINGVKTHQFNDDTAFWRGFGEEGNIILSEKIQIRIQCTIHFHKFPFDQQICEFQFGSYRFHKEEVMISWKPQAVQLKISKNFNGFELTNVSVYSEVDVRPTGNFSIAAIQFTVKRNSSHHMLCIALPSFLLTCLSYISLCFGLQNRPRRFAPTLLIFIILLLYYYLSTCLTQPVPYLKSIDIFVLICTTFSFIVIVVTSIVDTVIKDRQFHHGGKSREYSKCVYWLETSTKIMLPPSFVFSVTLYIYVYL